MESSANPAAAGGQSSASAGSAPRHPTRVGFGRRLLVAAAGLGLAGLGQLIYLGTGNLVDSLVLYLVGAAVFAWGLPMATGTLPVASRPAVSRGWPLPLGLCLLALSLLVYSLFPFFAHTAAISRWSWAPFLLAVVCLIAASWLYDGPSLDRDAVRAWWRRARLDLLIALAVGVGALLARLYNLHELPFGTWFDEADAGLVAREIIANPEFRPVVTRLIGDISLIPYPIAVSFRLFGDSTFAMRLVTVAVGAATVPVFYLLARLLFSRPAAVVSAVFFAGARWHLNFSRIAMHPVFTPLFAVGAIYCLVKAARTGRLFWYTLSGVFLACGLWSYAASRFILLVVAAYGLLLLARAPQARAALRRGGAVLVFATFLAAAPLLGYTLSRPDDALARTHITSVFTGKTPAQSLGALGDNFRKHLLMFNFRGDPNGRHNLPGAPMLDPITAVLAALGVAVCLRRRGPTEWLALAWLGVPLLGGILTLEFEAPQSLRSIGSLPAVFLLVGIALEHLRSGLGPWRGVSRRRFAVLCLVLLGAASALLNANDYFRRQASEFSVWASFSTAETLAAREMSRWAGERSLYVSPLFANHPTIRYLAPEVTEYTVLAESTPPTVDDAEGAVILLDNGRQAAFEQARRYYPHGEFTAFGHLESGPPVLYGIALSPEDVAGVQGLNATYTPADGGPVVTRREPNLAADWTRETPVPAPFTVAWEGTLRVPKYGSYLLGVASPGPITVWLNGEIALGGGSDLERTLQLAEGNYRLRVEAEVANAAGVTELYWQSTHRARETVPPRALYVPPVSANGLLGTYYPSPDWSGTPAFARVDPALSFYFHVTPLPRPYSVEWRGRVYAPAAGTYLLGTQSIDHSWVWVGDRLVVDNSGEIGKYVEGAVTLEEGFHDLTVRFVDRSGYSHIHLYWTPPGGPKALLPSDYLFPPGGPLPAPALPPAAGADGLPLPAIPLPEGEIPSLAMRLVWEAVDTTGAAPRLTQPRGVAVDPAGNVYVADTGNRRVVIFDSGGKVVVDWPTGFEEPVAVAVNPAGEVLVLDAAAGWVGRFSSEGRLLGRTAGPELALYRPRGFFVDGEGRVYIADTGGRRVVRLAPTGELEWQLGAGGVGEGLLDQPTDVVVDDDGVLYVVDVEVSEIRAFSSAGELLGRRSISKAYSVDGPHLALGPEGDLYGSDPETGRVLRFPHQGGAPPGAIDGRAWGVQRPVGLAVDPEGRVYLADSAGGRVLVLAPPR